MAQPPHGASDLARLRSTPSEVDPATSRVAEYRREMDQDQPSITRILLRRAAYKTSLLATTPAHCTPFPSLALVHHDCNRCSCRCRPPSQPGCCTRWCYQLLYQWPNLQRVCNMCSPLFSQLVDISRPRVTASRPTTLRPVRVVSSASGTPTIQSPIQRMRTWHATSTVPV